MNILHLDKSSLAISSWACSNYFCWICCFCPKVWHRTAKSSR